MIDLAGEVAGQQFAGLAEIVGVRQTHPGVDIDRGEFFQTVADTGSINAASKTLCLSYGKVSKDLEELERMLGHQLFERSSRGLELTSVGEDILRSARNMADSVQSIIERASERAREGQREVL